MEHRRRQKRLGVFGATQEAAFGGALRRRAWGWGHAGAAGVGRDHGSHLLASPSAMITESKQ